ncbi:MAG: hypothetical protein HY913_22445 [Desulfomonile tiedjei]|nr:hypothetical protein [Desulfomonile tiedjei]
MEDQTILATSENFGTVSVCHGGVVHINLPHCSLKFLPADFAKFCELIANARMKFDLPRRADGKPHLQLVPSDIDQTSASDDQD